MSRIQLAELTAFSAVAEHRSFTKAAARIGIALPTMSQTIRSLEDRLGVRLFNRTTRSVALTEAGERLLADVQPILQGLEHALENVNSFRDKPIGALRLAVVRLVAARVLGPIVRPFLAKYPSIRLEVVVDETNRDLVGGRFDVGICVGQPFEADMTVLRLIDPFKMLAVAAPAYAAGHATPAGPSDLRAYNCIRYRFPRDGSIQPWLFRKDDQDVDVAVEGSLIVNDVDLMLSASLDGAGVGYLAEPLVASHLARGDLVNLLEGWSGEQPGVFLYHPSRRQTPAPLRVFLEFVEAWRRGARA